MPNKNQRKKIHIINNGCTITEKQAVKSSNGELKCVVRSPYPVSLCLLKPGGVSVICKTGLKTNLDLLQFCKTISIQPGRQQYLENN